MGLLEFDKLPINTLVGADWKTFKAVTANKTIDKGFRNKYFLTKSVCRLLSLLQPFEDARYRKIADKPLEMSCKRSGWIVLVKKLRVLSNTVYGFRFR